MSNCEMCGIEVPFVHVTKPDEHIYCEDCLKLVKELEKQESATDEEQHGEEE